MRIVIWLLSLWLALSPAFADSSFTAPTTVGTAAPGQIPGTTTNDNACVGCVGEYVESSSTGLFTAAITIAAPAVISGTHNFQGVAAIVFTTSGALPTGITSGTTYYTSPATVPNGNFNLATTVANAISGTFITTTGSQSGTQTGTSTIPLTTNTPIDTAGISLTAGDWDIWFSGEFSAASTTSSTATDLSLSTVSATRQATPTIKTFRFVPFIGNGNSATGEAGPWRVSITSTTTYFAVPRATFTISTMNYTGGTMRARRVR